MRNPNIPWFMSAWKLLVQAQKPLSGFICVGFFNLQWVPTVSNFQCINQQKLITPSKVESANFSTINPAPSVCLVWPCSCRLFGATGRSMDFPWRISGLLLPLFLLCGLCGLLMTLVFLFRTGRNCAVWCLKCLPCWLLWVCLSMSPSRAFSGLVFLGPFPVCLARFPFKLLPNTWAFRSSLLKGMPTWLVPCVLRPPLPCFSAWPCACSTRWSLLLCGGVCVLLPWTKSTWENCGFTMSPCLPGCLELAAILLGLLFNALLPWNILSSCGLGSMQNAGVSFWCVWCGNGWKWDEMGWSRASFSSRPRSKTNLDRAAAFFGITGNCAAPASP